MILSGLAMVVVGVWLTLQGIGGNLAARIVDWATGAAATPAAQAARSTGNASGSSAGEVDVLAQVEANAARKAATTHKSKG